MARFQDLKPSKFFGTEIDERAEVWLKDIEHLFNIVEYSKPWRMKLGLYQLKIVQNLGGKPLRLD